MLVKRCTSLTLADKSMAEWCKPTEKEVALGYRLNVKIKQVPYFNASLLLISHGIEKVIILPQYLQKVLEID